MKALLISGDALRAHSLRTDLFRLGEPVFATVATTADAALGRLANETFDACVVDLAQPPADADRSLTGRVRLVAPHIAVAAIVATGAQALEAVGTGADGFARPGPLLASSLADTLRGARLRRPDGAPQLRALYVTLRDPVRDPTVLARVRFDVAPLEPGDYALPAPWHTGPLAMDAVVVDMADGANDLVDIVQDVIARTGPLAVVVLAEPGDRTVAAVALRLGVRRIVAKSGAWPLRLLAAIEEAAAAGALVREAHASRASEARLRLIVESLPAGVAVISADGIVLAMNRAGAVVTGLDSPEHTNLFDRVLDEDRATFDGWLQDVTAGSDRTVCVGWRHDSLTTTVELSGTPLPRSNGQGWLILATASERRAVDRPTTPVAAPARDVPAITLEQHAAVKAHLDNAAREAGALRVQLSQAEAERRAYAGHMEDERATLEEMVAQSARRAELRDALLQETEEALRMRTGELMTLRDRHARLRADHETAVAAGSRELLTVCDALEAAEQARAVVVGQHAQELDAIRTAFAEREAAYASRISELESKVSALRSPLEANGATADLPSLVHHAPRGVLRADAG